MAADGTNIDQKPQPSWKIWKQRRYILAVLVFLGRFSLYSLRANMSVAIVAMTQDRFDTLENGTEIDIGPELKWDNKIQGYILSSFFYGYLLTQILGGLLSRRFGSKLIFGTGVAVTALLTMASPWLAEWSPFCLMAGRILIGAFEGVAYASVFTIWAKWIPPSERSRITSQSAAGMNAGTVFAMIFYGYLAQVAGWRTIFWCSGALGILWCLAWFYFTAESPGEDPRISTQELQYIQQSLKESLPTKSNVIRWKAILTSKPVWALNLIYFCETWGFYTLLTLLPKYFKDVYKFDLSKAGDLSALPYVAMVIMIQISGQMADWLIRKNWLTVTQTRKIFTTVGSLSQTSFMMGAAFCDEVAVTVLFLVMASGMGTLVSVCVGVNALDIAPLHSSVLVGIANTFGTMTGIVSPTIAGYIISTENPTVEQWRIVFYIAAGMYLFGAIFYNIFGSGLRQQWDMDCDETSANNKVSSKESCEKKSDSFS